MQKKLLNGAKPNEGEMSYRQVAVAMMTPMLQLSRLALVSEALPVYIIALISSAINVRFLNTGTMLTTYLDDSCFEAIFQHNKLQNLEEIRVLRSSHLSVQFPYYLIHNCPKLKSIKTLESWSGISEKVCYVKPRKDIRNI